MVLFFSVLCGFLALSAASPTVEKDLLDRKIPEEVGVPEVGMAGTRIEELKRVIRSPSDDDFLEEDQGSEANADSGSKASVTTVKSDDGYGSDRVEVTKAKSEAGSSADTENYERQSRGRNYYRGSGYDSERDENRNYRYDDNRSYRLGNGGYKYSGSGREYSNGYGCIGESGSTRYDSTSTGYNSYPSGTPIIHNNVNLKLCGDSSEGSCGCLQNGRSGISESRSGAIAGAVSVSE